MFTPYPTPVVYLYLDRMCVRMRGGSVLRQLPDAGIHGQAASSNSD